VYVATFGAGSAVNYAVDQGEIDTRRRARRPAHVNALTIRLAFAGAA
jgi:hypothetical protein